MSGSWTSWHGDVHAPSKIFKAVLRWLRWSGESHEMDLPRAPRAPRAPKTLRAPWKNVAIFDLHITSPRERDIGALASDFWLHRSVAEVLRIPIAWISFCFSVFPMFFPMFPLFHCLCVLCFSRLPASASAFIAIALPGAPTIVTSFLARSIIAASGFVSLQADDFSEIPACQTLQHLGMDHHRIIMESWIMA